MKKKIYPTNNKKTTMKFKHCYETGQDSLDVKYMSTKMDTSCKDGFYDKRNNFGNDIINNDYITTVEHTGRRRPLQGDLNLNKRTKDPSIKNKDFLYQKPIPEFTFSQLDEKQPITIDDHFRNLTEGISNLNNSKINPTQDFIEKEEKGEKKTDMKLYKFNEKMISPKTGKEITVGKRTWKDLVKQGLVNKEYIVDSENPPPYENIVNEINTTKDGEDGEDVKEVKDVEDVNLK